MQRRPRRDAARTAIELTLEPERLTCLQGFDPSTGSTPTAMFRISEVLILGDSSWGFMAGQSWSRPGSSRSSRDSSDNR